MKNYKRLFRLIKGHYRYLVISILMILLIQALELVSPMLVKNVLDEGLSGVEYPWIEVLEEEPDIADGEKKVSKVALLLILSMKQLKKQNRLAVLTKPFTLR